MSTDSEEQLTSYAAQISYYTEYIKGREDWEFVGVYTDEGISGCSTKRREGFQRMISDAMAGKIDLIITKSVSRFARNTVDTLNYTRMLKEYDVGVFSDFVLTLVAAYEKGIPIAETVVRKSSEIKQSNLLEAKERAVKLSNTVLLPVLIFKILPLLAIMLIPIMQQISSM